MLKWPFFCPQEASEMSNVSRGISGKMTNVSRGISGKMTICIPCYLCIKSVYLNVLHVLYGFFYEHEKALRHQIGGRKRSSKVVLDSL